MKDFLSNHHAGTYNVLLRTNCETLQELADNIRKGQQTEYAPSGSISVQYYENEFYQLWGLRNVGRTWIKEFCLKYNLVAEYSAWELKNKSDRFWIFNTRKPSTIGQDRVLKKIRALQKSAEFYGYKQIAHKCNYYIAEISELKS
jgi:hypothetical protein